MFKEITACRVCGNKRIKTVMDLGSQALTGVFPESEKQYVEQGPVELVRCNGDEACGLVQLKQSYDVSMMYGENYGYRSGLNRSMVQHLENKVAKIMNMEILEEGDLIIDVGSNDGTTLKAFPPNRFKLLGVDPSGEKFREYYRADIDLVSDFFSAKNIRDKIGSKSAKLVTSFSMFYDLEDPVGFAKEIYSILSDDGIWVCEQSYLPKMLEANSFDTICHEHLEFYSLSQIDWILGEADLRVIDIEFNEINGGSFSFTAAKINSKHNKVAENVAVVRKREEALDLQQDCIYDKFRQRVNDCVGNLNKFLVEAKNSGKTVYGIGASTKGNVLLQLCGINKELLKGIGEVNSDKYGKYTPGTNIPILPEDEVLELRPDYLLVLPWHFREFFIAQPKLKGLTLVFPLPELEIVKID